MKAELFELVVRTRAEHIRIGDDSRIDSFVKLEGGEGLTIGRGVHIASFAHIGIGGGTTFIGDYAAVASGGKVLAGSSSPKGAMSAKAPYDQQKITRAVTTIGAHACVCTNAVVREGVTMGEGSVLAAGSVLTCDIPAWEIWGGIPAVKIGTRKRLASIL